MNEEVSHRIVEEKIDLTKAEEILDQYKEVKGPLIPVLQKIQDVYGYLPKVAVELIAKRLGMTPHQVFGVITFYAQFHLEPRGKHILRVCCGTACHVKGAKQITDRVEEILKVKPGETTSDKSFTYERVGCIGPCSMAPAMMIDDLVYGDLDPEKAEKILESTKRG